MHNPRVSRGRGGRSSAGRRGGSSASRRGRQGRESEQLMRENWEMEARLRQLQAKVEEERAAVSRRTGGGPRWAAGAATRGPITTYAKDLLATAAPAAQARAERQVRLRAAQEAGPAQPPPTASVPPLAVPSPAPARPTSARGSVAGLLPHRSDGWSTAQVGAWLGGLGLARYQPVFEDNEISGPVLLDMTAEDLDYLDVKVLAHRKVMLKGIAKLQQAVAAGDSGGLAAPSPRSPPLHAHRMAAGFQADAPAPAPAPAPPAGKALVHWSHTAPMAGGVAGAGASPGPAASLAELAAAPRDEAAEAAAFKDAVQAWRGGAAPKGAAVAASAGDGGGGWANPADSPPAGGGRFAASLTAAGATVTAKPAGAFAASLGASAQGRRSSPKAPQDPRLNPLLAEGDGEEAEHAAFRDAVMAWRGGDSAPSSPAGAPTVAGAATSPGRLGAGGTALGEEAAKVLGVEPGAVEGSSWYTGYKTLFGGEDGTPGGVEAFNAHVQALHEARRAARGAPELPASVTQPASAPAPVPAPAPASTAVGVVQLQGGGVDSVAVRVTSSRGGVGAWDGGKEGEEDVLALEDLPAAPDGGDGTVISLLDDGALAAVAASAAAAAEAAASPPPRFRSQAPAPAPALAPRDIWALQVDF